MENIEKSVKAFNELVINGDTLQAMELFYSREVSMQENEEEPRRGKELCMAHEVNSLKQVKELRAILINQAIDPVRNIVFSEWEYHFTTKNDQKIKLAEVSVQQWKDGQIIKEKFYYKEVLKMGS